MDRKGIFAFILALVGIVLNILPYIIYNQQTVCIIFWIIGLACIFIAANLFATLFGLRFLFNILASVICLILTYSFSIKMGWISKDNDAQTLVSNCVSTKNWVSKIGSDSNDCLQLNNISGDTNSIFINFNNNDPLPDHEGISMALAPGESKDFTIQIKKITVPPTLEKAGNLFFGFSSEKYFSDESITSTKGEFIVFRFFQEKNRLCLVETISEDCKSIPNFQESQFDFFAKHTFSVTNYDNLISLSLCDGNSCVILVDENASQNGNIYLWLGYYFPTAFDFQADIIQLPYDR